MASSSSSTPSWKYDVFLSFRGDDTRRNFTDLLYRKLTDLGIDTFIDNQLRRGEQISPALLQAIEDSRFSIIIFSKNYASSGWCLDELSKILECVHEGKHTAFPVFYELDPSHVRHQRGSYEEAFKKHEEAYKNDVEKVAKWREALIEASGYSGWDTRDQNHSEVISDIVVKIFNETPVDPVSSNDEHMVGMDSRIKDLLPLLCLGSPDVRMVGIWGMGGIGKTTLATEIYRTLTRAKHLFQSYCCFLENVREKSQKNENLVKELLSQILKDKNLVDKIFNSGSYSIKKALHLKKVLIVLDDVDHIKQLDELAGGHNWFGPASRIIITTRDMRLLEMKNVDATYEIKELQRDDALLLFRQHAFKDKHFEEHFEGLCDRSLDYTNGNPLAIKILGSLLYKRDKVQWDCELEKLNKFPNEDVQKVLRISFDGLEDIAKNMFLDIACFFKGRDKDHVSELLKSCDLYPETGMSTLRERGLITISWGNRLDMHDLIQEMGREIVRQQSIEDPSKRSRLWMNEDVKDVLTSNSGGKTIQGIFFDLNPSKESLDINANVLRKMKKLRVLEFQVMPEYYFGEEELQAPSKIHLTGDLKFLSKNLRYLNWEGYPLKSLPPNFDPRKLFELNMRFSLLKQLWKGEKSFSKLKYIDLSHSQDLIRTPDLSGASELKKIILKGCTSLVKIHASIETLENLSFLNLRNCSKLEEVAKRFCMLTSLETLDVFGCSKLRKLPDDLRMSRMTPFPYLHFSGCSNLEKLPKGLAEMTSLEELHLSGCTKLKKLPDDIGTSLKTLNLSGCANLEELPKGFGKLMPLWRLNLSGCSKLEELPRSIAEFTSLVELDLSGCTKLKKLPDDIGTSLKTLNLSGCAILEELPKGFGKLTPLRMLNLSGCSKLEELPRSILELTFLLYLNLSSCTKLKKLSDDIGMSLKTLNLSGCANLEELPKGFGKLMPLSGYHYKGGIGEVPHPINLLTRFEYLSLQGRKGMGLSFLLSLPRHGLQVPSLELLNLSDCNLQEGALPSDMSCLHMLKYLDLSRNSFITLPSLTPLRKLAILKLNNCKSLRSLTELPKDIELVLASNCESLETFSCPPNAYQKSQFDLSNCGRLEESVSLEALMRGIQTIPPQYSDWFQIQLQKKKGLNALVPGSRIPNPERFINRSVGNSIILKLPPDFHHVHTLAMGYCSVLGENPSRWNSDHLWLGFAHLRDILYKGASKQVSHLKFSFSGYDGKAPLVVKKCDIRLLYAPLPEYYYEESDAEEVIKFDTKEINEYYSKKEFDTIDATGFSPSPAFDEECCYAATLEQHYCERTLEDAKFYWDEFGEECRAEAHTLILYIKVEGYNSYVPEHIKATTLTQDSKPFEPEERVASRDMLASFGPDVNQYEGTQTEERVAWGNMLALFLPDLRQLEMDDKDVTSNMSTNFLLDLNQPEMDDNDVTRSMSTNILPDLNQSEAEDEDLTKNMLANFLPDLNQLETEV